MGLVVDSGSLTAVGGSASLSKGIHMADGTTINGGSVTTSGGSATDYSQGIYSSKLTVNGGRLDAASGTVTGKPDDQFNDYAEAAVMLIDPEIKLGENVSIKTPLDVKISSYIKVWYCSIVDSSFNPVKKVVIE